MAGKAFLEKAYLAYFGRPVDANGATAFAGATEAEVEAAFFASPESKALYGDTFGMAQINQIYLTLFGRPAEEAGLAYWDNQIKLGLLTPAGAALGIQEGARNSDITALQNKLVASAAFTASLDTPAEAQGYNGDASAASARDFLKTITLTAATQEQIDLAVQHSVAAYHVVVDPLQGGLSLTSNGSDTNHLALTSEQATNLTISGDTPLDLNDSSFPAVTTVNASGFNSGLGINLSSNPGATAITVGNGHNQIYTGAMDDSVTAGNGFNIISTGAGNDQITGGNGSESRFFSTGFDVAGNAVGTEDQIIAFGNRIVSGGGKDTITLANGAVDLLRYFSVSDSSGADTDVVNGFQASFVAGQIERIKMVDGVETATLVDVMARDIIDVSNMPFAYASRSYAGEASGLEAVTALMTAGSVKAALDTSSSILYIDVDGSGTLDGRDLSIQLVGVTDLEAKNFDFFDDGIL
jgi:hypothetical protein